MPEMRQRRTFRDFLRRCMLPALPLLLIFIVYCYPSGLEITEIPLSLSQSLFFASLLLSSMVWQAIPYRRACQGSGLFRALYDLVPFEAYCLLLFAQWHFWVSAVLLAVLLVLVMAWEIYLMVENHRARVFYDAYEEDQPEELQIRLQKVLQEHRNMKLRIPLLLAAILMAGPCLMAIFAYNLGSPVYTPVIENAPSAFQFSEDPDKLLEDNAVLLASFNEGSWSQYRFEEKLALLQQFHELECARLGVTAVPVMAKGLKGGTLATYDSEENNIAVSTRYLNTASALDCMNTMCHETYHRHQSYLLENIDMDSPVAKTEYFRQLREWYENSDNYIDGNIDYDNYAIQPLEASANAWADAEMEQLMVWIPQG